MTDHRQGLEQMGKITFASSLSYPDVPRFAARATPLMMPPRRELTFMDEIGMFLHVLKIARKEKVVLLNSAWGHFHPDLLASATIGLWPQRNRPVIVMAGDMWEPNTGFRGLLEKLVVRLADRAIHRYVVQSSEELTIFPATWGISPSKARLGLYYFSLTREQGGLSSSAPSPGKHIFAGGNSHRDYEPLLETAKKMTEYKFVFATHRLEGRGDLPPNVIAGPVSHQEFVDLMVSAAAVIVPMRQGLRRAVGQQTYLNAMWLGKPTIVNDVLGVRDHIQHGETGWIVDGSSGGYMRALQWVFDPANQEHVACLCDAARQVVREQFTAECHAHQLVAIIDEAIQEQL